MRDKVTETEYNFKTLRRLTIHQTKSSFLLFNAKVGNGVYWPKINLNGSNFHDNMRRLVVAVCLKTVIQIKKKKTNINPCDKHTR